MHPARTSSATTINSEVDMSTRSSAAEAMCNATIGFAVSWALTVLVLGYSPSNGLAVTAMFFVASFARAFIIREAFRKWQS
jgi:hypothetical protein